MAANAYRFGLIMRYLKGPETVTGYMYEPWHFRYVGIERAEKIYNKWKNNGGVLWIFGEILKVPGTPPIYVERLILNLMVHC